MVSTLQAVNTIRKTNNTLNQFNQHATAKAILTQADHEADSKHIQSYQVTTDLSVLV